MTRREEIQETIDRIGRRFGLLLTLDYMTGSGYRLGLEQEAGRFVSPRLDPCQLLRWIHGFEEGMDRGFELGGKANKVGQAIQGVKNGPEGDRLEGEESELREAARGYLEVRDNPYAIIRTLDRALVRLRAAVEGG